MAVLYGVYLFMTFSMFPAERLALLILASIYSLRMLGLFMILPVFAIYAHQLNGATPFSIGIALGIYGLTQAIFQIPFGYISDRLGRKPLIILGLMLLSLGSGIAAMSQSIFGVMVGRGIQGMGATGGVIMALLADLTRQEIRLRAMAVIGISIGFSFALAFILGPILYAWLGLPGIFWITAILSLAAILLVIGILPDPKIVLEVGPRIGEDLGQQKTSGGSAEIGREPVGFSIVFLYIGVLVLHASLTAIFLKIPQVIRGLQWNNGFDSSKTWQFYLPVLLASVILTIPIILMIEKTKKIKSWMGLVVLLLGFSELSILLFSPLFFPSLLGLSLSMVLFFTAFNVLEASLPSLISKTVVAHRKGTALGMFSALQFLGLFLGGTLGGLVDSWGGLVAVLLFCVILALAWFFLMFYKSHGFDRFHRFLQVPQGLQVPRSH